MAKAVHFSDIYISASEAAVSDAFSAHGVQLCLGSWAHIPPQLQALREAMHEGPSRAATHGNKEVCSFTQGVQLW